MTEFIGIAALAVLLLLLLPGIIRQHVETTVDKQVLADKSKRAVTEPLALVAAPCVQTNASDDGQEL